MQVLLLPFFPVALISLVSPVRTLPVSSREWFQVNSEGRLATGAHPLRPLRPGLVRLGHRVFPVTVMGDIDTSCLCAISEQS